MNSFSEITTACNLKMEYEELYNKNKIKGFPKALTSETSGKLSKYKVVGIPKDISDRVYEIANKYQSIVKSAKISKAKTYNNTSTEV